MSDTMIKAGATSGRASTALIAGSTALLMLLGACSKPAEPVAPAPAAGLAAPTTSTPQLAADDEVAPPAKAAAPSPKPAPAHAQARQPAAKPTQAHVAAPVQTVAAAPVCQTCGTVENVTEVKQKGEASGIGAVGGAVVGAALGNRVGGGNGRKAMTVLGAVGGGLAGHEIEKQVKSETVYDVRVHMDNGSTRTVTSKTAPAVGAKVVVEGDSLRVQ